MHDLIYCFRMLRKRPSFTVVAVLTLALAIGASTALFSIVDVVVLNPFAYKIRHICFLYGRVCRRSACRISFACRDRSLSTSRRAESSNGWRRLSRLVET